ncbi:hypothetical protein K6W37_01285 [Acetobacter senegalensis]|nr:hypothetical protein [Acetobacter senegalensis]MCG4252532.1 hypothetical protein [Acetobacter senegalensis]
MQRPLVTMLLLAAAVPSGGLTLPYLPVSDLPVASPDHSFCWHRGGDRA